MYYFFPAPPWYTVKSSQIFFSFKSIFLCLVNKYLGVRDFVLLEELAKKYIAYMSVPDEERCDDVPHIV